MDVLDYVLSAVVLPALAACGTFMLKTPSRKELTATATSIKEDLAAHEKRDEMALSGLKTDIRDLTAKLDRHYEGLRDLIQGR